MVNKDTVFSNYQSIKSRKFAISLLVEFIGVAIFSFLGTTVTGANTPWVNGLALAVMIYTAANISGGHLNPAVTLSTLLCGFYPVMHSILYICLQVVGSICGSLLAAGLVPGASINMGDGGPGCFDSTTISPDITRSQLFGWETMMTFTLISAVYACGVADPGHGSFTPLIVGLSLTTCAMTGGKYTGAALNPARVFGPLAVFRCGQNLVGTYIGAHIFASFCACCIFAFVSGWGPLMPLKAINEYGLNQAEAIKMWVTGQPPARLLSNSAENIQDVLARIEREGELKQDAELRKNLGSTLSKMAQLPTFGFGKKASTAQAQQDNADVQVPMHDQSNA